MRRLSRSVSSLLLASAIAAPSTVAQAAPFAEPDVRVVREHRSDAPGESLGWAADNLGDLDRDGVNDYALSAPLYAPDGPRRGRVLVYSGASGDLLHVETGEPFDQLGISVARVGDVDGDGVSDYAAGGFGSPNAPIPNAGRVVVLSGATHAVLRDWRAGVRGQWFGYDVGPAGDLDRDGHADVIIGSPLASEGGLLRSGRVDVYSGRTGTVLWSFAGTTAFAFTGSSVTGLTDLDGDGVPEQLVGALGGGALGTGLGYVLSGATGRVLRYLLPDQSAGNFGDFFAHDAGDVDGDGVRDLYMADYGDSQGSGKAYVFSGARYHRVRTADANAPAPAFDAAARLLELPAVVPAEGLGPGRGAGDVNGDGLADLIVGAYTNSAAAAVAGAAYVFSGADGAVLRSFTCSEAGAQIGFDAIAAGDLDRDGAVDFLLTGVDVAFVVAGGPGNNAGGR